MNLLLELYIVLCVALLLFDIAFLVFKNKKNYEFYPRNTEFEGQIKEELVLRRETGVFSQAFSDRLERMLESTRNLITLQTELERVPEAEEWFREDVYAQLDNYRKKTDYEQAYYTYVISTFHYEQAPVPRPFAASFMAFLDSGSLYTFCNAMNAIYNFGQVDLLVTALEKVDERGRFYHKKLLVDGILASKVDLKKLGDELMERFDRYGVHMQESLLDVFRMSGCDAGALCTRLMQDPEVDDQVRCSAMRYFIKWPSPTSRDWFLSILDREETPWVEQMLAIQALGRYLGDEEIYLAVREKVTSSHWYVRVNAVEFLHKYGMTRAQLAGLLELQDRYAAEALLYQYRTDEETTGFILETMEHIRQREEQKLKQGQQAAPSPTAVTARV